MLVARCVCARSICLSLVQVALSMCLKWLQGYSDRILHVIPSEDYRWYHRDFATAYVRDKVAERYLRSRGLELLTTLMTDPTPEYAVLFGHLFEIHCLGKLAAGGRFPMRCLDEPGDRCMSETGAVQQAVCCHLM